MAGIRFNPKVRRLRLDEEVRGGVVETVIARIFGRRFISEFPNVKEKFDMQDSAYYRLSVKR